MRGSRLRRFASMAAATLFFILLSHDSQGFSVFKCTPSEREKTLIPVDTDVGYGLSKVLWRNCQLDVLLLVTTESSCSCMLQHEWSGEA